MILAPGQVCPRRHHDKAIEPPTAAVPSRQPSSRSSATRFSILNAMVDRTMCRLTGSQFKVWSVLWRDTKKNGLARTGQADIARRTGLKLRQVNRIVAELKQMGLVEVVTLGNEFTGISTYRVKGVVRYVTGDV